MSLRESLESTLPEVARVVHIFNQTAEAIPTSVAPPRSWRRAGGRACKDVLMGKALRCGFCGSACLEGARVRDCGGRGRAEEAEEERGRGKMKAAVVLLLLKALTLVLAATMPRRSSRELLVVVIVLLQ